MTIPRFVASEIDFCQGDAAIPRLFETNDREFADSKGEILRVDPVRWMKAQQYERDAWMVHNANSEDANNEHWALLFDQYTSLPDHLGDVVEWGAGPFTNLRIILQERRARRVVLTDPLIREYLNHPQCAYKGHMLNGLPVETWSVTAEDYQPGPVFHTAVMINVLHHCYDARQALRNLRDCLRPNGIVVFGEWPREIDPVLEYDEGHPLAPHADTLEDFISQFETLYRNGWFFIGRRAW